MQELDLDYIKLELTEGIVSALQKGKFYYRIVSRTKTLNSIKKKLM